MQEEFKNLSEDEKLKADNDFLKMKIMLQHGGQFGGAENSGVPPEIENQFLNNIMAFEQQYEKHKTIKIFDKIGKPGHFKPVGEIIDNDIEDAWRKLRQHLNEHGVDLDVCSPNITTRELYRFATEELFEHETDDIDLPGWSTNFIYDEFYPDPVYDNSRLVEQDLFRDIFTKRDLFYEIYYASDGFVFNGLLYDDFNKFSEKINLFKSLFSEIELEDCTISSCEVKDLDCVVQGTYKAVAQGDRDDVTYSGAFNVRLILKDSEYWHFKEILIDGFGLK